MVLRTLDRKMAGCVLLMICLALGIPQAWAGDVVVVRSKASAKAAKLYQQAITGFEQELGHPVEVIVQAGELTDPERLAAAVRAADASAVVAVGPTAARALRKNLTDRPVIFCMVSHALQLKLRAPNTTGVTMQPTPVDQIKAFKRVVPNLSKVGVIYHPKLSGTFVAAARGALGPLGISLIERQITDHREVPAALKEVVDSADGLWVLRDGKVVTQEFFKQTLLLQAERKLPVLVFSERFVAKGALCSFAATYASQGRQAARIYKSIQAGASPADMPFQAPDGTLTINTTAAAKMGIKLGKALLESPNVKTVGK